MKPKPRPSSKITTAFEDITPEMAEKYLERNVTNRPIRPHTLDSYVADMKAGKWLPTHQGIAFNDRQELIDGQHRLKAIAVSGETVRVMVTRGLPAVVGKNRMMDAVDRGAVRSIANQLQLQHGYKNAAVQAACAVAIAHLCVQTLKLGKMSVGQVLEVLKIYGRHITEIHGIMWKTYDRRLTRSPVMAALAFARQVEPHEVDRFIEGLTSGANLTSDSPILQLRNYLFRPDSGELIVGDRGERRQFVFQILDCAHLSATKQKCKGISRGGPEGFIYFAKQQEDNVAKIAKVFFTEPASLDLAAYRTTRKAPGLTVLPPATGPNPKTAADVKLTPLAEQLLRGKSMSEALKRKGVAV